MSTIAGPGFGVSKISAPDMGLGFGCVLLPNTSLALSVGVF